jgi:hypothetical protein
MNANSKWNQLIDEITDLKELIREMVNESILSGKLPDEPRFYECNWCKQCAHEGSPIQHKQDCFHANPLVKKIMEEK